MKEGKPMIQLFHIYMDPLRERGLAVSTHMNANIVVRMTNFCWFDWISYHTKKIQIHDGL